MKFDIGQLNQNKHLSEEVRKKISKALKSKIAWNVGLKHTEETRQKISQALKGRKAWNKGILRTEEEKLHISEGLKKVKI